MIGMSAEEAVKPIEITTDGKAVIALLKKQLVALEEIAEGFFGEVQDKEREWVFLTEALVAKIFGLESPQHDKLVATRTLGTADVQVRFGGPEHERLQQNFEERSRKRRTVIKAFIEELKIKAHMEEKE
jgi:hypothetical protein